MWRVGVEVMAFDRKSAGVLRTSALCAGLWLGACAQGAAVKKEPFDSLDNGAAAEGDGGDSGGDNGKASGPGGGNQGGTSGGKPSGNGSTEGNNGASAGDAGMSDAALSGDASVAADASENSCQPGTSPCGDLCVDLMSSASNCGRCGRTCPGGQACSGTGTCLAPAGCSVASFGTHDYFVCTNAKEWADARADCKTWGLDLAIIETPEENAFVTPFGPAWIGYNDIDGEDAWRWVAVGAGNVGPSPLYENWREDEPNNNRSCTLGFCSGPGEDCGQLYDDGTWNDAKCDNSLAYLCETY